MALHFTTVSQSASTGFIKALVYGGPGCGKTVLTATLGAGTILISAEAGTLSVRRPNLVRLYGEGNPSINYDLPILVVQSAADFADALKWCQQAHEARQFHTVALDSLSEIGEVVLNTQKRVFKDPRQAYGGMAEQMESSVRAFRDLPGRHVVFTAKMEGTKDELSGVVRFGPSMPGRKLGPALPYFFDEVFRLAIGRAADGQPFRYLQTQPDIQFDAKDRSGALAPMEPPHLSTVFAKILGA